MSNPRHELGRRAEDAAATWLTQLGWRVMARRWRSTSGEIDLVCADRGGILVGVEVKLRRTGRAGSALEAVDARRLPRLRGALADYARESTHNWPALRVDLVAATPAAGGWRLVRLPAIDAW
jgi:putative endonuclease